MMNKLFLFCNVACFSVTVATTTMTTLTSKKSESPKIHRKTSLIEGDDPVDFQHAGYTPFNIDVVLDASRIDLDQVEIEQAVEFLAFSDARRIYEQGGHSFSVATLHLDTILPLAMPARSIILGSSENGTAIRATLLQDTPASSTTVVAVYPLENGTNETIGALCQVGGSLLPETRGCFAERGIVTIGGSLTLGYEYSIVADTNNLRSIGKFSTDSADIFLNCDQCPLATHQLFVQYYGDFTYADDFVQAAIDGSPTELKNGNVNFGFLSLEGRAEAVRRFPVLLNIWMYVVGLLEFALEVCELEDAENDRAPFFWDEAYAIYTGSLEGSDGSGNGKLLHHLADEMCVLFDTCVDSISAVNEGVVEELTTGLSYILTGQCENASKNKDRIVSLMTVPLIQGLLMSASVLNDDENTIGHVTGFSFAVAALPLLHDCDEAGASLIYNAFQLPVSVDEDPFLSIKAVVEASYECLGISCDDIGNLEGAGLCADPTEPPTRDECDDEDEECSKGSSRPMFHAWLVFMMMSFLLWSS